MCGSSSSFSLLLSSSNESANSTRLRRSGVRSIILLFEDGSSLAMRRNESINSSARAFMRRTSECNSFHAAEGVSTLLFSFPEEASSSSLLEVLKLRDSIVLVLSGVVVVVVVVEAVVVIPSP